MNNINKLAQEIRKRDNPTTTRLDMCMGQVIGLDPLTLKISGYPIQAVEGKNLHVSLGMITLLTALTVKHWDYVLVIPFKESFIAVDVVTLKKEHTESLVE
jgi:hypothetical protein